MSDNYSDIINNPHHTSTVRKRMTPLNRAAQFAPFAALTGHDASIREAARITSKKLELCDKAKDILNIKLNFIKEHIKEHPEITVIHFVPDTKKDGGAYVEDSGSVRVIDEIQKTIIFTNKKTISIETIQDIKIKK